MRIVAVDQRAIDVEQRGREIASRNLHEQTTARNVAP
jgi:hypothetical protein